MKHRSEIAKIKSANPASTQPLPRLLFVEDISERLHISVTTIRHYTGNPEKWGHLLPRWFKLPGARRLAWLESDVLAWIEAGRVAAPMPKRPRGRPTKAEQLRAGKLGV